MKSRIFTLILFLTTLLSGAWASPTTNTWRVVLNGYGSASKVTIITILRDHTGMGLKDAKNLVEQTPPIILMSDAPYSDAKAFFDDLDNAGADAVLEDMETLWALDLISAGSNSNSVLLLLVKSLGITLSQAHTLLRNLPVNLLFGVGYQQAHDLATEIENRGGTVSLYQLQDDLATPSDMSLDKAMTTGAALSWNKGGSESLWAVRYGQPAFSGNWCSLEWDFEDGTMQGWTYIDANNDGWCWHRSSSYSHSGQYSFYSDYGYGDEALDNWLVSPEIDLGGQLSFWLLCFKLTNHYAEVYVSTGSPTNPADFTAVTGHLLPTKIREFQEFKADLSAYQGQKGYVAIRHYDPQNYNQMNIDDISYTLTSSYTVPTWKTLPSIAEPKTLLSKLNANTYYAVQVAAQSADGQHISPWTDPIVFSTGKLSRPEDLKATVLSSTATSISWTAQGDEQYWKLVWWEDEVTENFDRRLTSDWTIVDADGDDAKWTQYDDNSYSHSGWGYMYSKSNGRTPDNWLIMPRTTLGGVFSLWARSLSSDYHEHFAIYVSTTDTDPSSFQLVSEEYTPTSTYTNYAVCLDDYADQQGYIAIRHFNSDDQYALVIDDICYKQDFSKIAISGTTNLSFSNLSMNTCYHAILRATLSEGSLTPWSEVCTFNTLNDNLFERPGNWNDPNCWLKGEVPEAGSSVSINADCVIPKGYLADADNVTVAVNGKITIKDGGKLRYNTMNGELTVEKEVKAGKPCYMGVPFENGIDIPDQMLQNNYSIDRFDQVAPWYYVSFNSKLYRCYGYRYTNDQDITLSLTGIPNPPSSSLRYSLSFSNNATTYQGYNFVANPYTCDCYITVDDNRTTARPYWLMNDRGELVPGSGPIAPLQGFFVKAENYDDILYFTTVKPEYDDPITTPTDVTVSTHTSIPSISWTAHGEKAWNIRYREPDNGTWQYWDFENGSTQGWTSIDADGDGWNWNYNRSSTYAHGGYYYLYSNTYEATDNYLISPKLTLGGILRLWVRGGSGSGGQHFTVYYSKNNWNVAQFLQASAEYTVGSSYKEFAIDLSDMEATGQGYIIIRHHNSPKDYSLRIDDMSYLTYPESGYVEPSPWQQKRAQANPFQMNGLKPYTTYEVQVQGIFKGEGRVSDWSNTVRFTTGQSLPTLIQNTEYGDGDSEWYAIDGRKLGKKPTTPGIYLNKGKKYVVK